MSQQLDQAISTLQSATSALSAVPKMVSDAIAATKSANPPVDDSAAVSAISGVVSSLNRTLADVQSLTGVSTSGAATVPATTTPPVDTAAPVADATDLGLDAAGRRIRPPPTDSSVA